jgi:hypothetical protein
MIHLGATRVNRVPQSMSFIQNLLFECCFLRHNQSILEPQDSFCILMETSNLWITFSYPSLYIAHALVIPLCSNDLIPHDGCEGDVVQ